MATDKLEANQTESSRAKPDRHVVGPDEFKQLLLKHTSRFSKGDSRPFAIFSLRLANLAALTAISDNETLQKVKRALRVFVNAHMRESDSVCVLNDDRILVLVLDTDDNAARQKAFQLKQALKSMKVSGAIVKPTVTVDYVCAGHRDLISMLHQLECTIDDHGNLSEKADSGALVSGNKEHWWQRYTKDDTAITSDSPHMVPVLDQWSNTPRLVISIPASEVKSSKQDILRLARELQAINHPGIDPLIDFWLDENEILCVETPARGRKFDDWLSSRQLNNAACVDLILQYLSIFLYLQHNTSCAALQNKRNYLRIATGDSSLRLCQFHHKVILTDHDAQNGEIRNFCLAVYGALSEEPDNEFRLVMEQFKKPTDTVHPGFSSLQKMRVFLESLASKLGAPYLTPRESIKNA